MNPQPHTNTPIHCDAGTIQLEWRIRGEYLEMPGLRLSLDQAARLWALDRAECKTVLDSLVRASFLQCDQDGRYIRSCGGY